MLNYVQDQSEHLVTLQKAFPANTQSINHTSGGNAYLRLVLEKYKMPTERDSIPRHERDHESKPRKCEHPSIYINWVERWNRTSFLVDWVQVRSLPQESYV